MRLVLQLGAGCLLFKRDLKRAYRQFYVDPQDICWLGYQFQEKLYFDVTLPMGLRSATLSCQRVTNGIAYICGNKGVKVVNLDDLGSADKPDTAHKS